MTTKEQLEKLVLGNRFIQSPRLQKLYKELLDRLEAENNQCDINGVSRSLRSLEEMTSQELLEEYRDLKIRIKTLADKMVELDKKQISKTQPNGNYKP